MRIVIDLQGSQTGSRYRGIGRYSLSLAKAMLRNRKQHDIVVALNGAFVDTIKVIEDDLEDLLPKKKIHLWHAPGPTGGFDPANFPRRKMAEKIREAFLASLRPDVVLVSSLFEGGDDSAVISIGTFDITVPVATVLYDLIPFTRPESHHKSENFLRWYMRQIEFLKKSRHLLAISDYTRQEGMQALKLKPETVTTISSAYDSEFRKIIGAEARLSDFRSRVSLTKPFLLCVGAGENRKNLHRLIQSYAKLPSVLRSRYQMLFVGPMPGDFIFAFRKTARHFGLAENDLIISNYVSNDELIALYNACSMFVFPSLYEGFGLPPLEAMACGAPVIAANTSSLPEVMGRAEAMFDPYSIESITEKMLAVLTDESFRRRLVSDGLAQARKFSWDSAAQKTLAALENIVETNPEQDGTPLKIEKQSFFTCRNFNILILKLDHLGDFILALPAISRLHARYPQAAIDCIVGSWNVDLAKSTGLFRNVYAFDFFKKSSVDSESDEDKIHALLKGLDGYELAIDFRRYPDTRFLLTRLQAEFKVGYTSFDSEIDAELDIVLPAQPDRQFAATTQNRTNVAEQMLALVEALPSNINDYVNLPVWGQSKPIAQGYVAVFPKAGNSNKEWPEDRFVTLVDLLCADESIEKVTIYFASEQESKGWTTIVSSKIDVRVGLLFPDLLASLSEHAVCLANNSGGAHLAAYLGLTVVALYSGHETVEEWAPPFGDAYVIHVDADCSPCHFPNRKDCPHGLFCLQNISKEYVFQRVMEAVKCCSPSNALSSRIRTGSLRRAPKNTPDDIVEGLLSDLAKHGYNTLSEKNVRELARCLAVTFPTAKINP
jgi:glycosyltransferase involved in cell wall biosynthesis/ADP-heptose:LPS heptosyltransferase